MIAGIARWDELAMMAVVYIELCDFAMAGCKRGRLGRYFEVGPGALFTLAFNG